MMAGEPLNTDPQAPAPTPVDGSRERRRREQERNRERAPGARDARCTSASRAGIALLQPSLLRRREADEEAGAR